MDMDSVKMVGLIDTNDGTLVLGVDTSPGASVECLTFGKIFHAEFMSKNKPKVRRWKSVAHKDKSKSPKKKI